jgi:hypothetical protein
MKHVLGHEAVVLTTRILSLMVAGILLLIGIGMLIMPEVVSIIFLSLSTGGAGINSLRADIGALFLGLGAFALFGALTRYRWVLLVPVVFLVLVVAGRLISMFLDPFPTKTIGALVMEIVFIVLLSLSILSHAFSGKEQKCSGILGAVLNRRVLIVAGAVIVLIAGTFVLRPQISARMWSGGVGGRMSRSRIAELPGTSKNLSF